MLDTAFALIEGHPRQGAVRSGSNVQIDGEVKGDNNVKRQRTGVSVPHGQPFKIGRGAGFRRLLGRLRSTEKGH